PECRGTRTKYLGTGIQRVEEELSESINGISLIRMDADSTRKKLSHYRMVKDMEKKKANILLGTQMVAKGLDFPDVTVSAIISADVALNLPDFRSGERAFQLFTQLAGRSGRGTLPGKVYIQSFSQDHYVFDYVKKHDYDGFYKKELALRKELSYPPFSRLIRIVFSFKTKKDANKTIADISEKIKGLNIQGAIVLGPAPAPVEKIRNMWRWHLILKGNNSKLMRQAASLILEQVSHMKNVRTEVDVDPINLL
ncbi:MAG TPA: primosomal protein N', partial [Nitrospirae bacterium]|nr:primosomal protein N' [Nitrospirota bacterium]